MVESSRPLAYTVSRLTSEVRDLLEASFPMVWVEGEISNLARPTSGHLYFSLKDPASQVRCAMFRNQNRLLRFTPDNGQQVLVRGRVSLYAPRGDFQLIIEYMEESGEGALRRAFEVLKQTLAAEGLFDSALKQPLPPLPRRIGVITSPGGAAIRDILTVLKRRFPAIPVLIYPVQVQGPGAAAEVTEALTVAGRRGECDVLILARGGGSLEDLQAFNEENVARAIHACPLPVVTGIGHEVDFTIADFVADHRAATPSAAAETTTPDQAAWRQNLEKINSRLVLRMRGRLHHERQRLGWLSKRLRHPAQAIRDNAQRLDHLNIRLENAMGNYLNGKKQGLQRIISRLQRLNPAAVLKVFRTRNDQLRRNLHSAWRHSQSRHQARLAASGRALETVSPMATLGRGYAILSSHPQGKLIRSVTDTAPGREIDARLADGSLRCTVNKRSD